jgi:rSAM/selenodomain-associated transferase 1
LVEPALSTGEVTAETRHRILDPAGGVQVPPGLCALAIMTKAPRAGLVKTRLQPPLTPEEAAALNVCFLRDTAAAIASCSGGLRPPNPALGVGVFTPAGSEHDYSAILPADFYLLPQRGAGFGERLTHAIKDLLCVGFESCCLIDSDSPTVTREAFVAAVEFLRASDDRLVLGPSHDGGYYLIGMKKLHRRVFEEIDWSTDRVFAQTIERARETGLPVETLPPFPDVDDKIGLRRVCDELLGEHSKSAPATKAFLAGLIAREGRERI